MRAPEPQDPETVNTVFRYHGIDHASERYYEFVGREVPLSPYNHVAVTIEEEAYNGGWLPNARPTTCDPFVHGTTPGLERSMDPRDLVTTSMRGEPGWDDDPQYSPEDGRYHHPPAKSSGGSDD
jgi:hypothetical protein